jgi:adenosylmethionine-8-amino-7-oxononanoate aminotransferase
VAAVRDQAGKISHAQVNISFHEKQLDLVGRLAKIMPKARARIVL